MVRQQDTPRVIIAGAGPIGAVLAYALRKRDIPVVLIEALATPEIDCRAASCHPPTVAMLDELGLLEDGLEQGLVSPVFNYIDRATGELVGRFDIEAMRDRPAHLYVLQWEQYKIVRTVLRRLRNDPDAEIRTSTRVTAVAQGSDKVDVTLALEDGSTEIISGRYLVGCDGGRSTIRKLAQIEFEGFTWLERFLKIDTKFDFFGLRPELSNRNYFSDPRRVDESVQGARPRGRRYVALREPDPARTNRRRIALARSSRGALAEVLSQTRPLRDRDHRAVQGSSASCGHVQSRACAAGWRFVARDTMRSFVALV